ncbi:Kazal domain-containing protein [Bradyrhizobium sp. BRP22]|uniref:Kazal-type serine protease inhibitor family protein n=1 Tax=Bradyrhizobium sp. BRP22 TaxID=2793821 RepID=UPI001CD31FC4|nr:Kazal-type serine protease inhibitor family protein [Bradyrhizobium sp. BRP22]MCA1457105.1 Kazal domain-containing protein [Bradyrhizobium sp. BRP22]
MRAIILVVLVLGTLSETSGAYAAKVGQTCGGFPGIQCDEGLWCDPQPGKCGAADAQGKCVKVPEICTRQRRPVCGCDGTTYSNNCVRQSKKVALKSIGPCK